MSSLLAEHAFRLLLRLLPPSFRREHGDEMVELFRWRLDRSRAEGSRAVARLWVSMTVDVVRAAAAERSDPLRRRLAPTRPRPQPRTRLTTRTENRMHLVLHDLKLAVRRLTRTPLFTLAAVAIVAIGIGANTAAFTVVDAFLLRPLGYDDPESLVHVYQDSDDGDPNSTSYPAYRDMTTFSDVFSSVAATSIANLTWERESGPQRVQVEFASASLFPTLGVRPSLGRWLSESEDHVGAGAVAVVSHWTWTRKLGADPDVVGRTVRLEGQPVTIVGVGPRRFNGSGGAVVTDFWLSISSTPVGGSFRVANLERRQDHWYDVLARLAPGVTKERAQGAMSLLAERLAAEFPDLNRGRDITVFGTDEVRLHPEIDAQLQPSAAMIMVVVGLVLVLSCSNLANLLLVRGVSRAPEVAVRRALGASSGRVIGLFLAEAAMIAALGGTIGLALAHWVLTLFPSLPLPFPGTLDLSMDARVIFFALALVALSAIFFGGLPAIRVARMKVVGELGSARGGASGRQRELLRRLMVGVQVAVSLILLVGAALFGRSLANAASVDPGVASESVAYLQTSLARRDLSASEMQVALADLRERIAALPSVSEAALATRLPVHDVGGSSTTVIEGYEPPSGTDAVELLIAIVGRHYFRTLEIPLLAGRGFDDTDAVDGTATVIVNETAARRYWGDPQAAIGKRMRPQARPDEWIEVVGVVGDSKVRTLTERPTPLLYRPLAQFGVASPYVVARSSGSAEALVQELRAGLREIDPTLPVRSAGTLEDHIGRALATPRALALVLAGFSAVAMLLASLGIHAVVAFSVAKRTSELGIRMALGAHRSRIVGLVVREVLTTVAAGLLVGLAGAFALMRLLDGILFGVRGIDPLSFTVAAAALLLAAALASYLPARRAAALDPVTALRVD